jgi:hypothetical protein
LGPVPASGWRWRHWHKDAARATLTEPWPRSTERRGPLTPPPKPWAANRRPTVRCTCTASPRECRGHPRPTRPTGKSARDGGRTRGPGTGGARSPGIIRGFDVTPIRADDMAFYMCFTCGQVVGCRDGGLSGRYQCRRNARVDRQRAVRCNDCQGPQDGPGSGHQRQFGIVRGWPAGGSSIAS